MSSSTKTIPFGGAPGIDGDVFEKKRQPRLPVEAQWVGAQKTGQGDGAHLRVSAGSGDLFVVWPVPALSS